MHTLSGVVMQIANPGRYSKSSILRHSAEWVMHNRRPEKGRARLGKVARSGYFELNPGQVTVVTRFCNLHYRVIQC